MTELDKDILNGLLDIGLVSSIGTGDLTSHLSPYQNYQQTISNREYNQAIKEAEQERLAAERQIEEAKVEAEKRAEESKIASETKKNDLARFRDLKNKFINVGTEVEALKAKGLDDLNDINAFNKIREFNTTLNELKGLSTKYDKDPEFSFDLDEEDKLNKQAGAIAKATEERNKAENERQNRVEKKLASIPSTFKNDREKEDWFNNNIDIDLDFNAEDKKRALEKINSIESGQTKVNKSAQNKRAEIAGTKIVENNEKENLIARLNKYIGKKMTRSEFQSIPSDDRKHLNYDLGTGTVKIKE